MDLTVSIIGMGNIGKVICVLLSQKKDHIFTLNIVDTSPNVEGAILDFQHGQHLFQPHHITYNSTEILTNSDFIFHCAGASVPKGQSRLSTSGASIEITEQIFTGFHPKKEPKIIVVSNPVEIISTITHKLTGLPADCIVGTGTFLDSIRMDYYLKRKFSFVKSVKSVLLGEHGSSVFISRILSSINGKLIDQVLSAEEIDEIFEEVKQAANEIKRTQNATIYGVSYCALHIFDALLAKSVTHIPVSMRVPDWLRNEIHSSSLFLSLYADMDAEGVRPNENYIPDSEELRLLQLAVDSLIPFLPKPYLE